MFYVLSVTTRKGNLFISKVRSVCAKIILLFMRATSNVDNLLVYTGKNNIFATVVESTAVANIRSGEEAGDGCVVEESVYGVAVGGEGRVGHHEELRHKVLHLFGGEQSSTAYG